MESTNPIVKKALNATAQNAKFAVTTKSGRSVVIEAPNYKAAEKEAKRRFGAGCIVDLVGNSVAANFNYKNKYQWFVVTPSMSGACILAGNEYREDAQEVFKEIKDEEGISCKVVARRTLERAGIDPNVSESWAKGIRKAVANAKFKDGDTIEWYGKRYKVIGILGSEMRINEVDPSGNLKHDGDYVISQDDAHVKRLANSIRTTNAKFKVGDVVGLKIKAWNACVATNGVKVDARTADELGWFTAIVKRPFHAEWRNYGMPDLATDYKAGERIRCRAWKPEGMFPCEASGHPAMWLSWKNLENCEFSPEDIARLEKLRAQNTTRNSEMKSTNPIVQKALNATVAKNANEPLIRYIKSNIQTKFPQSSLEGYTDGVTSLIERGNGKITILADRKARPALDQLKAKFEPDYIFAFVDYGRGKTGFTMTPRAHTQRGEFKVANAVVTNAMAKKQFGNVTAFTFGDGLYSGINVSFGPKIEGETPKEVIAKAKHFLAEFEKAAAGIKSAIAWMSAL